MSLVGAFGEFVRSLSMATLPSDVVERARVCLLNGYGVGMGCHDTSYAPVARSAALAINGEYADGATLLADGRKTSLEGAVLANAALFHGRAQEDASGAAHLGAELIPLLTAMVEVHNYPMDRLLPALVAGYEIGGLLEEVYAGHTTPAGLRSSTIYGPIACAAAAARLMELPAEQAASAMALAASFTGGNLQAFADGTDEWRYQVGMVARSGLVAAHLAQAGAVTAPHAIEGKAGLIPALARVPVDVDALVAKLGAEWKIYRVAFKPFPVCAFNQTPVTTALRLRDKIISRLEINAICVRMNPYETGYAGMDAVGPFSTVSGTLMSIPFCIATTLVHGAPSMAHMTSYHDDAVNDLVGKVDLISDPDVAVLSCCIELEMSDGNRLIEDLKMTARDYAFDWNRTSELIRTIGVETDVPSTAYDRLERFCRNLPDSSIADVLDAFAEVDRRTVAGRKMSAAHV